MTSALRCATKSGYDVIRLDEIVPVKGKTFDEARPDVLSQLRHERAADKFGDLQEQLQQKVDQSGETLESLAHEFGMTLGSIPEFLKGTGGGDLGSSKDLQAVVFGDAVLGEHKLGGPVPVGDDRLVLVKDLSHALPTPKELPVVRDLILAQLRKQLGSAAALAAADAAVKSLQSGRDFDTVAKDLGVTAEAARFVGRQDPSVTAQIRDAAFKAPKPSAQQPVVPGLRPARRWRGGTGRDGRARRCGAPGSRPGLQRGGRPRQDLRGSGWPRLR